MKPFFNDNCWAWQANWADKFWGIWASFGVFSAELSALFGHCPLDLVIFPTKTHIYPKNDIGRKEFGK